MAWVRFRKKDMPGGLWSKCKRCSEMIFTKDLLANFKVCAKCGYHMPATVDERISFTCDEGTFTELFQDLMPVDRLGFKDKTTYEEKLAQTREKVKRNEAMTIGTGKVHGHDIVLGVMNFQFLGGSMGVVVGEKVTLAVELALERGWPLVLVCASGGARMHEGALSLMQMAKTCAALARFSDAGGLYISVLTDPTTGGVTASFATMADVILAEPESLIGFAGPRVIQNTIKQELPEGFQRSEFLLERGQIDAIVTRDQLRERLRQLIEYLAPRNMQTMPPEPPPESFLERVQRTSSNGSTRKKKAIEPEPDRLAEDSASEAAADGRSAGRSAEDPLKQRAGAPEKRDGKARKKRKS